MPLRGSTLKTRTPALVVLVVSIALALYTGWHLRQALDAGHELRRQMSDLSLATMTDVQASSAVSLGEQSLMEALNAVLKTAHHNEAYLAVECLGVLLGLIFLRRPPATLK